MRFINRKEELARLTRASMGGKAGLVVVWGRRRLGKSRLLTEWRKHTDGVYSVADESSPTVQRQYLAEALSEVFPGFADVAYSDWTSLLDRLSREARQSGWRGPLVLDEFPYLASGSPELPSVLQRWVDREKRGDGILLALSGSCQRMMMDTVLNAEAPLYGRADEILKIEPLSPGYIGDALNISNPQILLDFYTCWGGVPRYWELAHPFHDRYRDALDELALSPLGVLHDEVDRLLRMEMPSAIPLRPVMDAIGMGAHKLSEIASRLQVPATSLPRCLNQLRQLGYISREVPFNECEKRSKKALYHLADPFLRLWFKVVAPRRGSLRTATKPARLKMLAACWPQLRAQAWEEICRLAVSRLELFNRQWQPAGRYWSGNQSEWDVVATSTDNGITILGECKSLARPAKPADIDKIVRALMAKSTPPSQQPGQRQEYVVFVPELDFDPKTAPAGVTLIDGNTVFSSLADHAESAES